jgi:hypothetical protein
VEAWFATSDRTQSITDQNRAGEGAITFSGAAEGAFRYTRAFLQGGFLLILSTDDPGLNPRPSSYATLYVGQGALTLNVGDRTYVRPTGPGALPYTYTGGRLTVDEVTLTEGTNGAVTVAGTLTPAWQTMTAGVEREVFRTVSPAGGSSQWRYVFEADGTFLMDQPAHPEAPSYTGTWALQEDGGLRVSYVFEGTPITTDYAYEMEGGQLVLLSQTGEMCTHEPSASCRSHYEFEFGMAAGSLQRLRRMGGDILVPAAIP